MQSYIPDFFFFTFQIKSKFNGVFPLTNQYEGWTLIVKIITARENKYTKMPMESEAHTVRLWFQHPLLLTTQALPMTMGHRGRMGLRGRGRKSSGNSPAALRPPDSSLLNLKTHLWGSFQFSTLSSRQQFWWFLGIFGTCILVFLVWGTENSIPCKHTALYFQYPASLTPFKPCFLNV